MKILLLSRYTRLGASSRLRFHQYLPGLRQQGIEVEARHFFSDDYLRALYSGGSLRGSAVRGYFRRLRDLMSVKKYDLVWLEKEFFPWLPSTPWAEWLSVPFVVDFDDAVFHRYDHHRSALVRYVLGHAYDQVFQSAAMVMVGNQYLADHAREAGAKNVVILPTVLDVDQYQPASSLGSTPVVGWIGSPSTQHYLQSLLPVLEAVFRKHPFHLRVIGAQVRASQHLPVQMVSWSEATEAAELAKVDIGVMPLIDGPWERGKCGYKLLQYMACGKPVVASAVGVNTEIVEPGQNGWLATTSEDWERALIHLLKNPNERSRMGAAGRVKVERHFSLSSTTPLLARCLRNSARS